MAQVAVKKFVSENRTSKLGRTIVKDFKQNKYLYMIVLPVLIFYIIFHYKPMYGAIIAFKDFSPGEGILGSKWVGFKYFKEFFVGFYFWRIITNTMLISLSSLVFVFPAPIILALLINEVKGSIFKRTIQTITYLPHFISLVVVCGMIKDFTSTNGIINDLIVFMGGERITFLQRPEYFRPVYIISDIWQKIGWESIIYLASLASIDTQLYEAAKIDGAGRWKQTFHVTLPGILPTIIILLILRLGSMMSVGFEKIILLYNPSIYETSDVIATYVYRLGLLEFNWGFSAAVGLFNSIINFILLFFANFISRRVSETSLW